LPGVVLPALAAWMDRVHPSLRRGELSGAVIAGGRSNLTYRITDGATTWALRRPPLAHVLPTAHDMAREYRVISALAGTAVPVPQPVALCSDPGVLGAPFYLMSFINGVVLDSPARLARLDAATAGAVCGQLVGTLLALHEIAPTAVGLGDFGRPDGFLARQLRRWRTQWDASQTQPRPDLDRVVHRLAGAMPGQPAAAVVHGDYRLTNVIQAPDLCRVAAVVDWEMATVGDPLTDLGLLIAYHTLSEEQDFIMPRMRPQDGFLSARQWADAYAAGSSRDLSALNWYIAFGYFKLAVIAEGIHHRYLQGKTVGSGFGRFGPAVPDLLSRALQAMGNGRGTGPS
jgi:aminoglycoside phosphotransferase (APT) family kinase protein